MHASRARFKRDIICEFMAPRRDLRRVIILCDGMPSVPSKQTLMEFWSKKGYWVFHPRYRGTWESDGAFLKESPEQIVFDVIDQLPKGFKGIWENKQYRVEPKQIIVMGSSFGGAAAILSAQDERVHKVVALSPVVDWTVKSKAEPLDWLASVIRESFGNAYRFSGRDWNKLKNGRFFNPTYHAGIIDGSKILTFHAKDDEIVSWKSVERFAKHTKSRLVMYKRGGHFSLSKIMHPRFLKRTDAFLKEESL